MQQLGPKIDFWS